MEKSQNMCSFLFTPASRLLCYLCLQNKQYVLINFHNFSIFLPASISKQGRSFPCGRCGCIRQRLCACMRALSDRSWAPHWGRRKKTNCLRKLTRAGIHLNERLDFSKWQARRAHSIIRRFLCVPAAAAERVALPAANFYITPRGRTRDPWPGGAYTPTRSAPHFLHIKRWLILRVSPRMRHVQNLFFLGHKVSNLFTRFNENLTCNFKAPYIKVYFFQPTALNCPQKFKPRYSETIFF